MRHARSVSRGPRAKAFHRRDRRAGQAGRRIVGAALAAVLATSGLAAAGPASADDEAVAETTAASSQTEEAALLGADATSDEAVEPEEAAPADEPPAEEPPPVDEPVEEPALADEPATDEPAPVEEPTAHRAAGRASEKTVEDDGSAPAAADVGIMADTPGPGPAAGDLSVEFRAAHPSSYTTANPGSADSSNVVTQLASASRFVCSDTIVYYQVITVGGTATGESVLTVTTDFETRFGNNTRVGITEVTAFLAKDDSRYLGDEEETISGTSVSGTWSDGEISLVSTIDDVEAGDRIVVEYHATLTCGNPPGNLTGNLQAASGGMTITQPGTAPAAVPGAGQQTVPLFAAAVRVALAPQDPTVTQAVCTDGVLTPPTLAVADGPAGITYSVNPAGPYAPGQTVTVTATLASGFVWPTTMPTGWTRTTATTATFAVTFDPNPCMPASPAAPTVTESVCVDGAPSAPTLTLATTEGITYSVDPAGPYVAGQEVTVTAELQTGYEWGSLTGGWVEVDSTTAELDVTFAGNPCTPASPQAPSVTESVCVDGAPSAPTLTLATTEGITYSVDPAGPYVAGQEVTVTAELQTGYEWGALSGGWVEVDSTTAELDVTFAGNPCTPATPQGPSVTESVCVDGAPTAPTLTLATTEGISYSVDLAGPYVAGQEVTVTAELQAGYEWGALSGGWVEVDSTTAELEVTFAGNPCTPVSPQDPDVTESVCVGGMPSAPTLTLATTEGITYSVDPEGPYVAGQAVTVTAVLAEGYEWGDLPDGWEELTTTTAERTLTFAGNPCIPVSPLAPALTESVCLEGEPTAPTLTLAETAGITYSADPAGPYAPGAVVTVTAVLQTGYEWGDMPSGWDLVDATTAEYEVVFDGDPCTPASPVAPGVMESVCVDGEPTAPALTLATTDGITYSVDPAGPYVPGQEVTVTAALQAGYGWGSLADGWVEVDSTTAELDVTFAGNPCTPASPQGPSVTESVCVEGAPTAPTLTPATTEGITYSVDPAGPYVAGQEVTVTAVLDGGYEWGDLPEGWERVDATTATYDVTFAGNPCRPTVPAAPEVTQAVCEGGHLTPPTLDLPEDSDGITYTVDPEGTYAPGQTVTVTATLDGGTYEWGDLAGTGWSEASPTTATLEITFDVVECAEVMPVAPTVTQSVCVDGGATVPTIVPASDTEAITYTVDEEAPYEPGQTVVVTATLADSGFAWGDMPDGWEQTGLTTATFEVVLDEYPCTPASPAAPGVTESVCVEGGPTAPTLTLATTEGITYSVAPAGPYEPGQVVTVTAVLQTGYEWGTLPQGWEQTGSIIAELDVTFAGNPCEPASPETPDVTESVCVEGEPTAPVVTVATTEGVTYSVGPAGPYVAGQEVTVTAELQTGYEWGDLPEGWVKVDPTTATYAVTLADNPCAPTSPVAPTVEQAVCVGGELVAPTLTLAETDGVVYTVDAEAPYAPGQTVTVTATLEEGYEWGELPEGWVPTEGSSTEATFAVSFDEAECAEVMPVTPTVTQSACVEGVPSAPTLVLADGPEGVTYTVDAEGPYEPGDTVVVTATLADGFAWAAETTAGWEETGPTTATYTVTLDDDPCIPASPVAPAVTQSQCPDGTVTRPTLTLPTTTGIAYSASPTGPYSGGDRVTVTAALAEGYGWGELAAGWTTHSPTATYEVTFDGDAECPKPPLPVTGPGAVGTYVALALMALLAGGLLLIVSRRRDLVS